MVGAVAAMERELLIERTHSGLAAARAGQGRRTKAQLQHGAATRNPAPLRRRPGHRRPDRQGSGVHGCVNPSWPHCDGWMWPHLRQRLAAIVVPASHPQKMQVGSRSISASSSSTWGVAGFWS
jgi:hypothetical protein